jgi:hypothetical protein
MVIQAAKAQSIGADYRESGENFEVANQLSCQAV